MSNIENQMDNLKFSPNVNEVGHRIQTIIGDNLDDICREIRLVGEQRAYYRSLFYSSGSTCIFDEKRKILKAKCVKKILEKNATTRLPANIVETLAYADEEYINFINEYEKLRQIYEELDAKYNYLRYLYETAINKLNFVKKEFDLRIDKII